MGITPELYLQHPMFNTPNPYLPQASPDLGPDHTRLHRLACSTKFQQACLEFSQSLWLQKKPAQAILQLNKSAFADTPTSFPFAALRWFLENHRPQHFIGNPVRHFQHLATRMAGPRAEARTWIAWACFHLSKKILPSQDFPPDKKQIDAEKIALPSLDEVTRHLSQTDRAAFLTSFDS
jgi:hypothetical protein